MAVGKGEVRPVFEPEKEWYRDLLQSDGKDPDVWLPSGMAFYYRASIIVGGEKVFRVTFDEVYRKWKIKFFKKYQNKIPDVTGSNEKILVEANLQTLEAAELESLDFIYRTHQEHRDMPMSVSFSGGKDSSVVLYLVRQLFPEIDVIYLNTTIEYPETEEYVRALKGDWGLNLIEVKPNRDFFDLCEELGPPSQYMRWCCKTTKFAPLNRLIEERYGTTLLMASGVRKNESFSRGTFSKIQVNGKIPNQLLMFPILEWNSLLVWLYTFWKKIPINEAYLFGRSRIGCWACPERRPKEFDRLSKTHPQLHGRLEAILRKYAIVNGIVNVDDWIYSGKWRLRATKYNKDYVKSRKLCSTFDQIIYDIGDKSKITQAIEFMKIFGDIQFRNGIFIIRTQDLDISFIGDKIRASFFDPSSKTKDLFERVLEKALNCINCGACVGSCKIGALQIIDDSLIVSEKCVHCLDCLTYRGLRKGCVSLNYNQKLTLIR